MVYSNEICPLIFKGAIINSFRVYRLENSLIAQNQIRFSDLSKTFGNDIELELGCDIRVMRFNEAYRLEVSQALINQHMSKNVVQIYFEGTMSHISDDTFRPLRDIKLISLKIFNMRSCLHSDVKNKWLNGINHGYDYDPVLIYTSQNMMLL